MRRALYASFLVAAGAAAFACSDLRSADDERAGSDNADGGTPSGAAPGGDLRPTANGIILVHASRATAFRLCFTKFPKMRPQPEAEAMPEANIVGVDVGSAVRVPPLPGDPGDVYLFGDLVIRGQYPPGQPGPTCEQLFNDPGVAPSGIKLGTITTRLDTGVHLLVVTGCPANSPIRTFTTAECGIDFDALKGNLAVKELELRGATRASTDEIPTQVLHLSRPLESARGSKEIEVSFGATAGDGGVDAGPGEATPYAILSPDLFGPPKEFAQAPRYEAADASSYANRGFRVRLGTDPAFALAQSLADIQRLSAPRDVPNTYFAGASNYVLLLLGDPDPRVTGDGGPDPDERRRLHFLAVPVVDARDAGATLDGSTGDGG